MTGVARTPITFADGTLDRAAHLRADAPQLLRHPHSRAILVARGGVVPDPVALAPILATAPRTEAVFLGIDDAGPLFAVEVADSPDLVGLREAAGTLSAARAGLLAYASAMLHWARTTRFCGTCGKRTKVQDGGHQRACPDGHHHHPRTDPVVIMLVVDGDRALLGRQAAWPSGRYSALAGFVEPGEALEIAVAREVREEAGVTVGDVRYVASQPWPFPASLMLGFEATWLRGEPTVGDDELEDARWFSRDELTAAAAGEVEWEADAGETPLILPPRTAIARVLIERWLRG